MHTPDPIPIDRRVAIKWMLTASAGAMLIRAPSLGGEAAPEAPRGAAAGYGRDPDLLKGYKPGDLWPLTFTAAQRREVAALCDVVIPADARSPSASAVGVTDFIDEFVSAPYPDNVRDGRTIVEGLAWLDAESTRRFGAVFAGATDAQRVSLCLDMAQIEQANPELKAAAGFFRLFRDLTASGFYTTPVGMKDIGYVGNVPLARFDGPPADLVERLGLADEVRW